MKRVTRKVKCRYGVEYEVTFEDTQMGAIERGFNLMNHCCCWVCHNKECKEPRNEPINGCEEVCEIWGARNPWWCKKGEK